MGYSSELAFLSEQKFKDIQTSRITSRDQIINPYELIKLSDYRNNRVGRRQYETDLARAVQIANMQQAAYDEWYNSESQQVLRQKESGLNPDINGVEAASAVETDISDIIPGQNIPTVEQASLDAASVTIGGLTTLFSGISGILGLSSQMKLNRSVIERNNADIANINANTDFIKSQSEGQYLSNIGKFVSASQSAISDRLAKSIKIGGSSFNIDEFFKGDFNDIYSSLAPSDDPRYRSAFDNLLQNSQSIHSDAYKNLSSTEEGRKKYLSQLASGYYNDDDDEMVGQLRYAVQLEEEVSRIVLDTRKQIQGVMRRYVNSINPEAAADSFNSQNLYNADFWSNMDGEVNASIELGMRKAAFAQAKATAAVQSYLHRQFNSVLNYFTPGRKERIGWMITAGAHMSWQDHFAATNNKSFQLILQQYQSSVEQMKAAAGLSNVQAQFVPTFAEAANTNAQAAYRNSMVNQDNSYPIWDKVLNTIDTLIPF